MANLNFFVAASLAWNIDPVSYTHLDVYKRQEYIIHEEGRTPHETTLLWIKNGKCSGYLYKNEYDQVPLEESNFTPLLMDDDAGVILRNYLAKNKVYKQAVTLFA